MNGDVTDLIVTGASGVVGQNLVRTFADAGFKVLAVSRRTTYFESENIQTLTVDSYSQLVQKLPFVQGASALFHLAENSDRRIQLDADEISRMVNFTTELSQAGAAAGVKRFVYASSLYAEDTNLGPYGAAKKAIEDSLLTQASAMSTQILRLPPVYGRGSRGMIQKIAKAVQNGWPLPFALATRPRSFLAMDNLSDLCIRLSQSTYRRNAVLVPVDAKLWSLKSMTMAIGEAHKRKARVVPIPFIDAVSPATVSDHDRHACRLRELKTELSWAPDDRLSRQSLMALR